MRPSTRRSGDKHHSVADPNSRDVGGFSVPADHGESAANKPGLDAVVSEIVADALEEPVDYVFRSNTGVDGE
ncbi:MAG: hypothetical protein AAFN70_19010 [Planctomycetota bacterium]